MSRGGRRSIGRDCTQRRVGLAAAMLCAAGLSASGPYAAADIVAAANPQRAWQNWTLNCQGCHRPDGTGSTGTAPALAGTVSKFLTVPGGRDYLGRVPGVATSALPDQELAELMNWMLRRFDEQHMPSDFRPFTAEEIGRLRLRPLRLEAAQMRNDLLKQADDQAGGFEGAGSVPTGARGRESRP